MSCYLRSECIYFYLHLNTQMSEMTCLDYVIQFHVQHTSCPKRGGGKRLRETGPLYIGLLGVQDAGVGAASPRGRGAAGHESCYPERLEKHCIRGAKMYYRISGVARGGGARGSRDASRDGPALYLFAWCAERRCRGGFAAGARGRGAAGHDFCCPKRLTKSLHSWYGNNKNS